MIGKLCDILRKVFDRHRTFQQYKAELNSTYMGRNGHVLDHTDRLKELHQILCNGECQGPSELMEDRRAGIDELALNNFCDELSVDYRINPSKCETLLTHSIRH